jgi:uncharacterized protein YifE (UPF0438 family)
MDDKKYETLIFKKEMGDLSEKTFLEVYDTNKEFVEFSQKNMSNGTGIFKYWLKYVGLRQRDARFKTNIQAAH